MQRALYISPVLPRRHGPGLAQRAYRIIEALTHRYRVSLLTMAHVERGGAAVSDAMSMCEDVTVLPLRRWTAAAITQRALRRWWPEQYFARYGQPSDWRMPSGADRRRLLDACARVRFDLVHVHRLYMLPLLRTCPCLSRVPAVMDVDDVESIARRRLARLARLNGDRKLAYLMEQDAAVYHAIERRELPCFERVFVCSEADRVALLAAGGPLEVGVLPNVVDIPAAPCRMPRAAGGPFVFLFVGTLDYYPNRDAVTFFCRDVVPLIRARVSRPFQVRIVSDGRLETRRQVPAIPELVWAPCGVDLTREYAAADAAIVPIRAGGGTRIKALEAFAHGTAVVSTPIGVEGLDVQHGEHALIGETADELADHAAAFMDDAALRGRLAGRACALVRTAYSPAALRRRLDEEHDASLHRARPVTTAASGRRCRD